MSRKVDQMLFARKFKGSLAHWCLLGSLQSCFGWGKSCLYAAHFQVLEVHDVVPK